MKMQIRPVFFFAVCTAALVPIGMLTAQAKAPIRECSASASKTQGHWSWRLIDGRKCWYAGKTVIPKSLLRWAAAAPAQAKVKVASPVSVATEKRSGPMDAQARMIDDDSFESRWRARVSVQ
ncbi:hypothetical protein [Bradyrhizobium sp. McL0615]|jgi:hypothetical protein|uniref:hypothetical protein n=1 Tax=Bradyrhizobium sp. McL0615 TaxID=3415673 RepID=UPI003CF2C975